MVMKYSSALARKTVATVVIGLRGTDDEGRMTVVVSVQRDYANWIDEVITLFADGPVILMKRD